MMSQAFIDDIFENEVLPYVSELRQETVRAGLDGVNFDVRTCLSLSQWHDLLFAGSILVQSNNPNHLETSLRIATGAIIAQDDGLVKDAGAILLDKLGNDRAKFLAEKRELIAPNLEARLGSGMLIDAVRRDVENSVLIQHSGERLSANSFQRELWTKASNRTGWVSASAPTAAGKTYIVGTFLHDQVLAKSMKRLLYLAPTRALIGEVQRDLKDRFRGDPTVHISSMPLPTAFRKGQSKGHKTIYVLTQERIHLLINALGEDANFDLLVVDEAQKIGDRRRGVILQDAIDRVVETNPEVNVVFISPSTSNPEILLQDRPEGVKGVVVDSSKPMVLQNIIAVQQDRGRKFNVGVLAGGEIEPLGKIELASNPDSLNKRSAFISAVLGPDGGTLVYVKGADDAEKVAQQIRDYREAPDETDDELLALSQLIKRGVHPRYLLADLVLSGIGFHYGNMPALVRSETERLFSKGKLKFLVCTSTLVEGVNLSCRNIVIRDPRKGRNTPMSPHDFWNLAGRAGRWGTEFQGNIICIDPFKGQAWENGIPERTLYEIQPESDTALALREGFTDYVKDMNHVSEAETNDGVEKAFAPVAASLLSKYITNGNLASSSLANRYPNDYLNDLDVQFRTLAAEITLPSELLAHHPGLNPIGLQSLLATFQSYRGDPSNLRILRIGDDKAFDRLGTIFNRITKAMGNAFGTERQARFYALIVIKWLEGKTLPQIIDGRIQYDKENGGKRGVASIIRDTLDVIQNVARFNAPRYLSAYEEILDHHLTTIGRTDLLEDELDIGTALEFGVSSRTLLSLISIGLSRMTSVELFERIADDTLDEEAALAWVSERIDQLESMGIPSLMVKEIRSVLLTDKNRVEAENG